EFRISDKMQILDPIEHNIPPLPTFNESLYINPETQTDATNQLINLIKANVLALGEATQAQMLS
ncbi:LysR family transcriptional regulator, partial [Shewanella sp. 0m-11]